MSWGLSLSINDGYQNVWDDLTPIVRGPRIRAALHGGVQLIEFEIIDDYVDAYRWAYDHIGAKVFVFDNSCNPPIAEGKIFESGISEAGNRIVVYGPWLAYMFSQVYIDTASWLAAGQTGAQVEDILTTECPDINTDLSSVDEPGTTNIPWQPTDNSYPGELIPFLASLSDATNREWYFWLQSAPMVGATPQDPIPYFKPQPSITKQYICWREDMAPGGLDLTPSLRELSNDVRVMWRDFSGVQQQTASATDADSQARYGLRERWSFNLGRAATTPADQYRDLILAQRKDPLQMESFRLNGWIYDEWGGKWPLWKVIADFPVKMTVVDLIPDNVVLGHTLDNKRTFITLAAEYDYSTNTLVVTPDTEDNRADAMLARHRGLQ